MQYFDSDHQLIKTACQWLEEGHEVLLFTVLKTWGSSPRPPGSLMLLRGDGVIQGSVSGGCVEEDLLQRYKAQQLSESYPCMIDYGVNRQDASRLGLPCGGRLELLVEQLHVNSELELLLQALNEQQITARCVELHTGKVSLEKPKTPQEFKYLPSYVQRVFGPQWQLLLIGAGHLSQHVSQIALLLGYRVIVCDPREEYTRAWSVEGVQITRIMPDEAVQHYMQNSRSMVIALTHDPRLDDMALLDALRSPAFYVGAIGSQRNCEARRQRLITMGLSQTELEQLHAPVGLDIGSHTPAEIAVSILAEVTQKRNQALEVTHEMTSASVSLYSV